jgi:hypothetical protein
MKLILAQLPTLAGLGWLGRLAGREHAEGLQPPNPWTQLKTEGIRSGTTMTRRRIVVTTTRRYN